MSQLADYILHPYKQTPMAPGELALEICVGPKRAMTSFMKGDDETLYFREEVQIPIMWPTVIKEVCFLKSFYMRYFATLLFRSAFV